MTTDIAAPDATPGDADPGAASATTASTEAGVELLYTLSTAPFPVQVSPATGAYRLADLTLVLTRRAARPIKCGGITVSVPVGTGATALAAQTTGMTASTNPAGWGATVAASGVVTFTPPGGVAEIDKANGLALSIAKVPVNRVEGRAQLTVTVRWRVPGDTSEDPWSTETVTLPVPKFPPTFSLGELRADPLRVEHGGSVTLSWQAANGTFRLSYGKADISVTDRDGFTAHNITEDTLFQLHGTSSTGSGEAEAVRSVWVTVTMPDVEVPTLTATRGVVTDRLAARTHTVPKFTATRLEHRAELSMRSFDPRLRRWSEPVRLPFGPAASAPAIAVRDGKLHLLFRPYDSEQLTWAEYGGRTWRTLPNSPGPAAVEPVALTAAGTSLICAYEAPGGEWFTRTSGNGTSWGAVSAMPAPVGGGGGGVSLCWDGTALHAALRTVLVGLVTGHHRRDAQGEWQSDGGGSQLLVHTPELVLWQGNLTCYSRSLHGSVWTRSRPKDGSSEGWIAKRMDDVRASNNVRLAVAGPTLYMLFPDSEGVLHLRSSDGSTWSAAAPVDEYRTLETPALAWYGNHLIAIGRGGACSP
ncbi:hypothetical protein ABT084_18890 [Streptomyces sp. NPDC002138]|uniref:hypothetical protein n=1 Tax=Streptomyces sp. NPDC002138 TaxID=3154410 RepID=UPI00331EB949